MRHVDKMLIVPLSFGPDFHEVIFGDDAPNGSHMLPCRLWDSRAENDGQG
jgi:hypothetical protein